MAKKNLKKWYTFQQEYGAFLKKYLQLLQIIGIFVMIFALILIWLNRARIV